MSKNNRFLPNVSVSNRKASFAYEWLDKYVAGIVLQGTEIKSIREGKVNLTDGYCYFDKGEIYAKGISIQPYAEGTHYNHEPARARKLLLKKSEIKRLIGKTEEKGLALIPTKLFVNAKGLAKVEISLGRGKKLHDKRESIKSAMLNAICNAFAKAKRKQVAMR